MSPNERFPVAEQLLSSGRQVGSSVHPCIYRMVDWLLWKVYVWAQTHCFRIRAARSRNRSNQNAGLRPQGILTSSVIPWAAQSPAWEPASLLPFLLWGGDRALSAGSLKTLGLPLKSSHPSPKAAWWSVKPCPQLVASSPHGRAPGWGRCLHLYTRCRGQMQGAQIMQWWGLFRNSRRMGKAR